MDAPHSAETTPVVSVIVPVYKTEKYLAECIESILAQTFEDFEMILVDDGSPDNSGKICDDYAARDPRIRVFHKENGGVSSARNLGLDRARGEWIAFVDSDDRLGKDHLRELHENTDGNVCISASGYFNVFDGRTTENRFREERVPAEEICALFRREKPVLFWAPWGKLFRNPARVGKRVRFREGIHYAEDWIFLLDYLKTMRCGIAFSSDVSYFYRRYGESSSARNFGFAQEMMFYRAGRDALGKVLPRTCGWAWSWQTSMLLTRVFPSADFSRKENLQDLERELPDFERFYEPSIFEQKIRKHLLCRKFYRALRLFDAGTTRMRCACFIFTKTKKALPDK